MTTFNDLPALLESIGQRVHRNLILANMLLQYGGNEGLANIPDSKDDHFHLFGMIETELREIAALLDVNSDLHDNLSQLNLKALYIENYAKLLAGKAGDKDHDRAAAAGLAYDLVDRFQDDICELSQTTPEDG